MAGQRNTKVTDILATKGALAFMAAVVAIVLFSPKGNYLSFTIAGKSLFGAMLMILGGFFLPDLSLTQTIQKRHKEILRTMPFTVDLIKICVEAGMDLEGALARVVMKGKGPLVEELERTLYEIRMGKDRVSALADMAHRIGLSDLSAFVTVLIQSEKVGMSIGKVLEIQSSEMRIKQSQRAREQVAKTPVIMMIPMVIFILPALFMIILGPAMVQIMTSFKAG
jgi:tight adherence protein C